MEVDLVGGYYEDADRGFDNQRCINWYPVFSQSGKSKTRAKLKCTPGSEVALALTPNGGSGNRGIYETAGGRLFGVWGNTLYEFTEVAGVLTKTERNTSLRFTRMSGNVSMSDNGTQLIIVDEGKGYIFDLSANTISQITDVDYPSAANQVVFFRTYFIVSVPGTKRFYWCASGDGTSWDALDFASIVSSPDNINGLIRTNQDVWMFGEKSIEPWQYTGGSVSIFETMPGAAQSIGTRNPWTVEKIKDTVYFLGSNKDGYGVIFRTNRYGEPEQVSTDAINNKIATVGSTTDATAYTYQEKGHYFYVITIPSLNITFAYDTASGKWHERGFWNNTTGSFQRHRSTYHAFGFGNNYVGFNGDNNLYKLSTSYFLDNTDYIRRLRTSAHQNFENKNVRYDRLELEFERGTALITGQGSDPRVFYRYADDGGYEFSPESYRNFGKQGKYKTRMEWASMGTGRDRIHEFVVSDPFNATILGAYMDVEVLNS